MSLLFIRHAETDLAGTFCGHTDPPVNAAGEIQIRALLEELAREPVAAVFSSDLERAATTAHAISRAHQAPLTIETGLRELHFGAWEALTWSQIEARDEAFARRWIDDFPNLTPPGAEPYPAFQQRILDLTERLLRASGQAQWAVVTHAGVLRVVLQCLCGASAEAAWNLTARYCCHFPYPQVQA